MTAGSAAHASNQPIDPRTIQGGVSTLEKDAVSVCGMRDLLEACRRARCSDTALVPRPDTTSAVGSLGAMEMGNVCGVCHLDRRSCTTEFRLEGVFQSAYESSTLLFLLGRHAVQDCVYMVVDGVSSSSVPCGVAPRLKDVPVQAFPIVERKRRLVSCREKLTSCANLLRQNGSRMA